MLASRRVASLVASASRRSQLHRRWWALLAAAYFVLMTPGPASGVNVFTRSMVPTLQEQAAAAQQPAVDVVERAAPMLDMDSCRYSPSCMRPTQEAAQLFSGALFSQAYWNAVQQVLSNQAALAQLVVVLVPARGSSGPAAAAPPPFSVMPGGPGLKMAPPCGPTSWAAAAGPCSSSIVTAGGAAGRVDESTSNFNSCYADGASSCVAPPFRFPASGSASDSALPLPCVSTTGLPGETANTEGSAQPMISNTPPFDNAALVNFIDTELRESAAEYDAKRAVADGLQEQVLRWTDSSGLMLPSEVSVEIFGSSGSLRTKSSDMDLFVRADWALCPERGEDPEQIKENEQTLAQSLAVHLLKLRNPSWAVLPRPYGSVPMLRVVVTPPARITSSIQHTTELHVDIVFSAGGKQSSEWIQEQLMLGTYDRTRTRTKILQDVIVFAKRLLESVYFRDISTGGVSTYMLTLLVLHFAKMDGTSGGGQASTLDVLQRFLTFYGHGEPDEVDGYEHVIDFGDDVVVGDDSRGWPTSTRKLLTESCDADPDRAQHYLCVRNPIPGLKDPSRKLYRWSDVKLLFRDTAGLLRQGLNPLAGYIQPGYTPAQDPRSSSKTEIELELKKLLISLERTKGKAKERLTSKHQQGVERQTAQALETEMDEKSLIKQMGEGAAVSILAEAFSRKAAELAAGFDSASTSGSAAAAVSSAPEKDAKQAQERLVDYIAQMKYVAEIHAKHLEEQERIRAWVETEVLQQGLATKDKQAANREKRDIQAKANRQLREAEEKKREALKQAKRTAVADAQKRANETRAQKLAEKAEREEERRKKASAEREEALAATANAVSNRSHGQRSTQRITRAFERAQMEARRREIHELSVADRLLADVRKSTLAILAKRDHLPEKVVAKNMIQLAIGELQSLKGKGRGPEMTDDNHNLTVLRTSSDEQFKLLTTDIIRQAERLQQGDRKSKGGPTKNLEASLREKLFSSSSPPSPSGAETASRSTSTPVTGTGTTSTSCSANHLKSRGSVSGSPPCSTASTSSPIPLQLAVASQFLHEAPKVTRPSSSSASSSAPAAPAPAAPRLRKNKNPGKNSGARTSAGDKDKNSERLQHLAGSLSSWVAYRLVRLDSAGEDTTATEDTAGSSFNSDIRLLEQLAEEVEGSVDYALAMSRAPLTPEELHQWRERLHKRVAGRVRREFVSGATFGWRLMRRFTLPFLAICSPIWLQAEYVGWKHAQEVSLLNPKTGLGEFVNEETGDVDFDSWLQSEKGLAYMAQLNGNAEEEEEEEEEERTEVLADAGVVP